MWSDHAPVLLSYALTDSLHSKARTWRLNESLMQDEDVLKDVVRKLDNYFQTNDTPNIDPGNVWEAHKVVIHGILINHGSRIKRRRTAQMASLLADLQLAEAHHKHAQTPSLDTEILTLRHKITDLMQFRAKAAIQICRRVSYESSNKCGKLLARSI